MTQNQPEFTLDLTQAKAPEFWRRLLAMIYDGVLIIALWVIGFALVYLPLARIFDLQVSGAHPLIRLYLLSLAVAFHLWFWTHGGQTIGMRAWRLKVLSDDGQALTWRDAVRRYLYALVALLPLGAGFLWSLFDADNRAWHDRWSRTRLVVVQKRR